MSFPVSDLLCDTCEKGLNKKYRECPHVDKMQIVVLAEDFMNFEKNLKEMSELCQTLDIWIEDPRFWAQCLKLDEKLQRHAPKWVTKIFQTKCKSQMSKLASARKISAKILEIFSKRANELKLTATDHYESNIFQEETQYLLQKVNENMHLSL